MVEGAAVALVFTLESLSYQPLGIYLMVPVLIAGLVGAAPVVLVTLLAETATVALVPIARLQPSQVASSLLEALPWLLTAIWMGLLGAWIHRLRDNATSTEREEYVDARRLLSQLRVVSRRLSSGLDSTALATSLLDDCLELAESGGGAVLVRNEDAGLSVLVQHGLAGGSVNIADDLTVAQCWATTQVARRTIQGDAGDAWERLALPLRLDVQMVGVVALDTKISIDLPIADDLSALLERRALPLDAALLFDDVRAVATVEERHRLAREIHNGVAQEVASLGYLVDHLAAAPNADDRALRVAHVRRELTRIVTDLRLSIFDLRSHVSSTAGLGRVLSDFVRQVGARSGMTVHLSLDEGPERLRVEVEEELLRIAQEAVTNARKHSAAANLWVSCRVRPPAAYLEISDDGIGIVGHCDNTFGLKIMRERGRRIGAEVTLSDRIGGGTRVSVSLDSDHRPGVPGQRPVRSRICLRCCSRACA